MMTYTLVYNLKKKLEQIVPASFFNVSFKETYRAGENSNIKSQGRNRRKVM